MKWMHGLVFACLALAVAVARPVAAATLVAVEYYNPALDHYFVTASADEIGKLDGGVFAGWQRTSFTFNVIDAATPQAGVSPVCRFYGLPGAGLDSHFYSASPDECADVRQRFAGVWSEESANAFGVWLPDAQTGQCPTGSVPVYRSWNTRADSNHRFTTDANVQRAMLASGYIAEGYGTGPLLVAMCAPDGSGNAAPVPACIVTASDTTPNVGTGLTLTATCTNSPTSFTWTGCASTTATCAATSASSGAATYTVVARNGSGASNPASVAVNWQAAGTGPVAKCTIVRTSQTNPPLVNASVVLKATCDTPVGSYTWNGCASTSNVCVARESTAGAHTYSVFARNAAGPSAPATITLGWVTTATPPGLCGQFPSYLYSDLGTTGGRVESGAIITPPGFAWNGAWTVDFVVPSTIGSRLGRLSTAEFGGEPTLREATISRTACDFRPTDPSGANGPIARGSGVSVTTFFTADPTRPGYPVLQPGATYYFNVRNFQPSTGTISCSPSPGRCDAFVEALLPK